jgi:hypothetical protein
MSRLGFGALSPSAGMAAAAALLRQLRCVGGGAGAPPPALLASVFFWRRLQGAAAPLFAELAPPPAADPAAAAAAASGETGYEQAEAAREGVASSAGLTLQAVQAAVEAAVAAVLGAAAAPDTPLVAAGLDSLGGWWVGGGLWRAGGVLGGEWGAVEWAGCRVGGVGCCGVSASAVGVRTPLPRLPFCLAAKAAGGVER